MLFMQFYGVSLSACGQAISSVLIFVNLREDVMTKGKQLMNDLLQTGLMAALVAIAMPDLVSAGDFRTTTDTINTQTGGLPTLITSLCYIGGIGLMGSGALKLKAHAENPGQTPVAHGVSRLLVGGTIASLPAISGWITSSAAIEGDMVEKGAFTSW